MKAISPVIATVIIVAVAIAISIAVALWITGLTSSFTGVEKLEVVNAYAQIDSVHKNNTNAVWNVTIIIKNTGTKTATIDQVFINNKPGYYINATDIRNNKYDKQLTIKPGETKILIFYIKSNANAPTSATDNVWTVLSDQYSSGQTVSIVVHTASGGQYPATITLP